MSSCNVVVIYLQYAEYQIISLLSFAYRIIRNFVRFILIIQSLNWSNTIAIFFGKKIG